VIVFVQYDGELSPGGSSSCSLEEEREEEREEALLGEFYAELSSFLANTALDNFTSIDRVRQLIKKSLSILMASSR
jgi:hypothetical protein